jgi:hypothetical protein
MPCMFTMFKEDILKLRSGIIISVSLPYQLRNRQCSTSYNESSCICSNFLGRFSGGAIVRSEFPRCVSRVVEISNHDPFDPHMGVHNS